MTAWWQLVVSVVGGLVVVWLLLIVVLGWEQRHHPDKARLRDLLRLGPDVARLLKRLATNHTEPLSTRIWLGVMLAYLLSPIDLIPDFIPVVGYLDDALIVALALRFATRHAGRAAVTRNWPGTNAGLNAILRVAGIPAA